MKNIVKKIDELENLQSTLNDHIYGVLHKYAEVMGIELYTDYENRMQWNFHNNIIRIEIRDRGETQYVEIPICFFVDYNSALKQLIKDLHEEEVQRQNEEKERLLMNQKRIEERDHKEYKRLKKKFQ